MGISAALVYPGRAMSKPRPLAFPFAMFLAACPACVGEATTGAPAKEAAPAVPAALGQMGAGASRAEGNNLFVNASFDEGTMLPWQVDFSAPAAGEARVEGGELCLHIQKGGANPYDVVLRQRPIQVEAGHKYQIRFKVHATAPTRLRAKIAQISAPYAERWSAIVPVSTEAQTFTGAFTAAGADPGAELAVHLGGDLAGQAPLTVCLDELEMNDPAFQVPAERSGKPRSVVRVNQVGYLPGYHKLATVKSAAAEPLPFQVVDAAGKVALSGKTRPFGEDKAAGELDHLADFSALRAPGKGYKLVVGKDESAPFDVGDDLYRKLQYDALAFFYHQRSGIEIAMPWAGTPERARPAGHPGDTKVPCGPEAKCSYALDVSGGWYDAGDHGKYVVNAGISVWLLQNEHERAKALGGNAAELDDGKLAIPENKNGKPDLLDEARWELEWMLRMRVPAGQPLAGMVHHAVHDDTWSPIPTRPDQDRLPRHLRPVSTAATLNLAATLAQSARLWKTLDPAFAKKCLDAAETAYAAARQHPDVMAVGAEEGGGAYGDSDVSDEFFWAAAELFVTTGKGEYKKAVEESPFFRAVPTDAAGSSASMSWDHVSALGNISLAVAPSALPRGEVEAQRRLLIGAADAYLRFIAKRAYRVPIESETRYPWGSNSFILDDLVILGLSHDFTRDPRYVEGVIDGMDYLLGQNPKVQSYVSGYGARPLQNPHHRFWAHQKDPSAPTVPPGVVSGGPNSGIEDPYAKQAGLSGCAPQACYVDHIESWSTNEIAINWNAPLAWAAAFLDDVARHPRR
jgi:endoglucanase